VGLGAGPAGARDWFFMHPLNEPRESEAEIDEAFGGHLAVRNRVHGAPNFGAAIFIETRPVVFRQAIGS
jgi:hypothetical protein